ESETSPFNNDNIKNKEKNDKENNTKLGIEIAQLYDSIISTPSSSSIITETKLNSFIKKANNAQESIKKEDIYCDKCDMIIKDPSHFQGTAHLVSSEREIVSPTALSAVFPTTTGQPNDTSLPTNTITRLEMEHGKDLAIQLMKKYGWEQGKGLGKNNQGLKYPVTATWKQDRLGLGHPNTVKKKITNKAILPSSSSNSNSTQQQQQIKGKQLAANAKAESELRTAMLHYMNN
ncbi:hypothetical protein BJ944DRAFT_274340, partial [Cunninghamella echinulata]